MGDNYLYSRSYAEDVTSVTSGASQGPHSFNLVFVCLFVCVTTGAIPYLSRICDYKGSTGLYITAVHNICRLLYMSCTVPIFVVLCIRLPDVEGGFERNRETRRKLNQNRRRIGDRMRQHKHTLEERSRRLQNKRERAIQRRSQETSEERSRRLQNARDRQSPPVPGNVRADIPLSPERP